MAQKRYMMILFLTVALFLVGALPGWAAAGDREVEIIVPPQGLTELDLEKEFCVYRGYPGAPVEVLVESSGLRLTALKISYDQRSQLLTAEEDVKLESEKMVATGETMVLTSELVRLPKGGEINTFEPEEMRLVVGGAFSYRLEDETFQGEGGFTLWGSDWVIEGERFDGSMRQEHVTATGSPVIRWEDGILQGEADTVITYDLASGQATAEGPTKTRFYQNRGVHSSGD
jgi:lipopolysaccharide export system protein LptA